MPAGLDISQAIYLSYGIVFVCMSIGFLCLRQMTRKEVGPGYWAAGFLANGLGFVFWSGSIPLRLAVYFLLGEILHVAGFFLLIIGAYRFTGHKLKKWNWIFFCSWTAVWLVEIALFSSQFDLAMIILKALRAVLFTIAGTLLVLEGNREKTIGIHIAGIGLIAWGIAIVLSVFISINPPIYNGLLVGLQLVASLGMVAMVLDKIRVRAEKSEEHIRTLEGILPICSYCKKIRDEKDEWHKLEAYIENRSTAEFTHGICPDCFSKHNSEK